jgi:hypothetical protein
VIIGVERPGGDEAALVRHAARGTRSVARTGEGWQHERDEDGENRDRDEELEE